jgi:hypothetical protein
VKIGVPVHVDHGHHHHVDLHDHHDHHDFHHDSGLSSYGHY